MRAPKNKILRPAKTGRVTYDAAIKAVTKVNKEEALKVKRLQAVNACISLAERYSGRLINSLPVETQRAIEIGCDLLEILEDQPQ